MKEYRVYFPQENRVEVVRDVLFIPNEEKVTKFDKTLRENNDILKTTLIFDEKEFKKEKEIRKEGETDLPIEEKEEPYRLRNTESLTRPTRLTDYCSFTANGRRSGFIRRGNIK